MDFPLTLQDLNGLVRLVRGEPVVESVTGVRALSGLGNNLLDATWGNADVPFIRLTQPHYGAPDAFGNRAINPIFAGLDPRAISNAIGQQDPTTAKAASGANLLFSAFGQYVDHGLTFIAKGGSGSVQIGAPGAGRTPGTDNPADLTRGAVIGFDAAGVPLHLNKTTAFIDQNQAYGSSALVGIFLREPDGAGGVTARLASGGPDPSSPGYNLLPSLRELITMHWQNDTRFVDGATDTTFRTFFAGLVDSSGNINESMLPALYQNFMGSGQPLLIDLNPFISPLDHIVAGDGRVNENVTLTAVHTIWARNHNFHVANLEAAGFAGNSQELFDAAKIINEAEYQRVVFTEFTDVLLGGMRGNGAHGWGGYNPNADPGISEEFAAAAYRFGHSLVTQTIQVLDAQGKVTDLALFDAFLNPTNAGQFVFNGAPVSLQQLAQMGYVPQPGYEEIGAGSILAGIIQQRAEEVDTSVVDALRNDLVRMSADLFSLNVARARDVGLGTLNQVRSDLMSSQSPYIREAVDRWAGDMSPYVSWEDFQARNNLSDALIAQFRIAYPDLVLGSQAEIDAFLAANPDIVLVDGNTVRGIDRVDLWVGGLAEAHINGGMVGQTFWVILHEQFDRLQEADRFYYLDRVENFPFYGLIDGGLAAGFGEIIERNTGVVWNGGNVFLASSVTAPDAIAPDILSFSPADSATGVDVLSNIVITFSEQVRAGSGTVEIRDSSGALVEQFNMATSTRATVSGSVLTLDPSVVLASGTTYNVTLTAGAVKDLSGNNFAGASGYDFTTAPTIVRGSIRNDVLNGTAGGDEIYGLNGNDVLTGQAGNDLLDGGAGADSMTGGLGDDVYVVDNVGDRAVEALNGGHDSVRTNLATYTLGSQIEDLVYTGILNFTGNGNLLANSISGGTGNDTLRGAAGNDTLSGGNGSDRLFGDEGNDLLLGGAGNDVLNGGAGADILDGGAGSDVFQFNAAISEIGIQAGSRDAIVGFTRGQDRIDLSLIDANVTLRGDQAFTFIGSANFTAPGQLRYADGQLQGNVNAGLSADFVIELQNGPLTLQAADIVL